MLGPTSTSHPPPLICPAPPIRSTLRPLRLSSQKNLSFISLRPRIQSRISRKLPRFPILFAENNDGLLNKDRKEGEEEQEQGIGSGDGGDNLGKDQRRIFDISWGDLLNPDPDNLLALALTGLLAWASVQVLWQLFFISLAILLAALKYSFIAALLLFILITLL
ncbi:hypothetical protein F2P56_010619 [Juglans regia]|uniref:Transmembrane protein n=2 Tax=Juglans regia TaxID=51240 RepID=A0A834CYY7_JUGRE|nr:uncharacterized protein LOC109009363 [Juglans regia]KAF5470075.1 hypothetical protein F2P56_010619 [Juglans regia]